MHAFARIAHNVNYSVDIANSYKVMDFYSQLLARLVLFTFHKSVLWIRTIFAGF
jgi:hypothetical protein